MMCVSTQPENRMNIVKLVQTMTKPAFINVVTTNIQFTVNNYEGDTSIKTVPIDYAELIAYQAACYFAQRFDDGVETCTTLEALQTEVFMPDAERRELVEKFYKTFVV
jgi:hypothetical protein